MFKTIQDGCIIAFGKEQHEPDSEEYLTLKAVVENRPVPIEGYGYRLKENLEWEQYQLPQPDPDAEPEEADINDYRNALAELGVDVDD